MCRFWDKPLGVWSSAGCQVAGLVLSLKNLEEHVMPAVMERLNRVERDEGKKVSGKEYIKEAEEADIRSLTFSYYDFIYISLYQDA